MLGRAENPPTLPGVERVGVQLILLALSPTSSVSQLIFQLSQASWIGFQLSQASWIGIEDLKM